MECWLGQLAQVPDEGPRWSWLLYLLILVVFPVINAIKDKFVQRAQDKADEKPKLPTVPTGRPAAGELPVAKAVETQRQTGVRLDPRRIPGAGPAPPRARGTPQILAKRRGPSPAPSPQRPAQARPAPPGPAPGRHI